MLRKPDLVTPISLWDVGVVMAVLVVAVVSYGAFFRSMETFMALGNDPGFWGFYVEGQNPWALTYLPGDATTTPVRTASTQQRIKASTLR